MKKTLWDHILQSHPELRNESIWDYKINAPVSMDDPAEITCVIWIGKEKAEEAIAVTFIL